jgi:hypothetical protein
MPGLPERLRAYLRELPRGALALLVLEIERAFARGDQFPGGELLLEEVRGALRESGQAVGRAGDPTRVFFGALEPFLSNDDAAHKRPGRIARAILTPMWSWICRDLVPAEAKTYNAEAARAAADPSTYEELARAFRNCVVAKMESVLAGAKADERTRRRVIGQIGTQNALDDVRGLLTILSAADIFTQIEKSLPAHIRNLADAQLDNVKSLLDQMVGSRPDVLPYALVLTMGRLAAPWQLIRLGVKAAETDDAIRIAGSPYAVAVTIVLSEVEQGVSALKADLKRGPTPAAPTLIKTIHDCARGLRTELDLSGDSPWAGRLVAVRADVSKVLKSQVESASGKVRRLLRLRPLSEIPRNAVLDVDDVSEAEAAVELVGVCRLYARELAINEMTMRTFTELQHYLETGTQSLLDSLRQAGEGERRFLQSQVDAAVRFCAKVFGADYAAVLAKAAEVAANTALDRETERKAAAAAKA